MRNLLIITGGSRGFGKAIVETCPLQNTDLIMIQRTVATGDVMKYGQVRTVTLDLSLCDTIEKLQPLTETIMQLGKDYGCVYLIHNAGSLGPLQRISTLQAYSSFTPYITLNLTSVMLLTSLVTSYYHTDINVINISSLAALKQYDCWSVYGSVKAARDHFLLSLAAEQQEPELQYNDNSAQQIQQLKVKCLSYAPGPLEDSDMQPLIRSSMPKDSLVLAQFVKMHQEQQLIHCHKSANVMWQCIIGQKYVKGEHVDYYDIN